MAPSTTMGMTGEKPPMVNGGLTALTSPHELALTSASTMRPIDTAERAVPTTSNRPCLSLRGPSPMRGTSGSTATAMRMVSAANTQRHEK